METCCMPVTFSVDISCAKEETMKKMIK